jgi:hypothetical protein
MVVKNPVNACGRALVKNILLAIHILTFVMRAYLHHVLKHSNILAYTAVAMFWVMRRKMAVVCYTSI